MRTRCEYKSERREDRRNNRRKMRMTGKGTRLLPQLASRRAKEVADGR